MTYTTWLSVKCHICHLDSFHNYLIQNIFRATQYMCKRKLLLLILGPAVIMFWKPPLINSYLELEIFFRKVKTLPTLTLEQDDSKFQISGLILLPTCNLHFQTLFGGGLNELLVRALTHLSECENLMDDDWRRFR